MKENNVVTERTKPVVLAGPIPLEDKSVAYNKIYWVTGFIGIIFGAGGGLPGMVLGCLLFYLFGKAIKQMVMANPVGNLSKVEYQLFSPIAVDEMLVALVASNTKNFKISNLKDKIVVVNKFAEYTIIPDSDNLTFRIEVNFTTLGSLTNRRLYNKLYQRAIQDIGPIAFAIQTASK